MQEDDGDGEPEVDEFEEPRQMQIEVNPVTRPARKQIDRVYAMIADGPP